MTSLPSNIRAKITVKSVIILAIQLIISTVLIFPIYKFTSTSNVFLDIFTPNIILFLSMLAAYMIVFTVSIRWTHIIPYTVVYLVFLITVLFGREQNTIYLWARLGNLEFYKWMWETQQLRPIELIGNACLFFPVGIIPVKLKCSTKIKLIIIAATIFILIPVIELIQYFTRLGVFDPIDIFLNDISIALGCLYSYLIHYNKTAKKLKSAQS